MAKFIVSEVQDAPSAWQYNTMTEIHVYPVRIQTRTLYQEAQSFKTASATEGIRGLMVKHAQLVILASIRIRWVRYRVLSVSLARLLPPRGRQAAPRAYLASIR
jgi:hypothetical protein